MILDVGSGPRPKGHVNCDLFIGYTPHTHLGAVEKTKLFVRCDATHLPFPDNSFDIVHSAHVLEHLMEPHKALEEFKRVSRKLVYIVVPNVSTRLSGQREEHLFAWDKTTLQHFLKTVFSTVDVYCGGHYDFIHGKRLDKMYFLKTFLNLTLRKFMPIDMTAICQVS